MRPLALALAALALTGCATNLSTLQTARPLERGQVQLTTGAGVFVPAGTLVTVADQGIRQGRALEEAVRRQEPYSLSEADAQQLLTAGLSLAVAPPGVGYELGLRAGVGHGVDVGLRYSLSSLRGDVKWRVLHREDAPTVSSTQGRRSLDVAVGLGLSRHLFDSPVLDVLELVQVSDFDRWDLEVPVYLSGQVGDVFVAYLAPKYVLSRTSLDEKLVAAAEQAAGTSGVDTRLPAHVTSHFVGTTVGVGAGYRIAYLYLELTGGYTFSRPTVFGQPRDLGGVTLYPAVGLVLRTPEPGGP